MGVPVAGAGGAQLQRSVSKTRKGILYPQSMPVHQKYLYPVKGYNLFIGTDAARIAVAPYQSGEFAVFSGKLLAVRGVIAQMRVGIGVP